MVRIRSYNHYFVITDFCNEKSVNKSVMLSVSFYFSRMQLEKVEPE